MTDLRSRILARISAWEKDNGPRVVMGGTWERYALVLSALKTEVEWHHPYTPNATTGAECCAPCSVDCGCTTDYAAMPCPSLRRIASHLGVPA